MICSFIFILVDESGKVSWRKGLAIGTSYSEQKLTRGKTEGRKFQAEGAVCTKHRGECSKAHVLYADGHNGRSPHFPLEVQELGSFCIAESEVEQLGELVPLCKCWRCM